LDSDLQDNLISAMRRATATRHADVEALLGLDAPFDLPTYGRVLRGFDAFLRAWEPRLETALPETMRPWFARRRRGFLAWRDLQALDLPPMDDATLAMPQLNGLSAALGSLYVLEGSALGGQVISRQVARQHGLHAGHGAAYFNGWGERTGPMWREFQEVLEEHEAQGADRDAACTAAAATFDALSAVFRQIFDDATAAV
jgi:heme oxygenase